ncbi:inositol monophosphatase family protein [Motiliproteus sediminis]|uniref:inositol monophosphatase family protein n=1 Tax=Motiliproteus sediminis TaxID=1468178 RepID=UPI001AEFC6E1|nr:inositol monophosphatase [Motiliproteus sediminis]
MSQFLLDRVQSLVERAAAYQRSRFRQMPPGGGDEKSRREFVSDVDITTERMLTEGLSKLVPEAGICGEEQGTSGNSSTQWVIDPLDGTTNYLSGLEHYSISVALVVDGRAELGMVYKPQSQECFRAWRGGRFQHNGKVVAQPVPLSLEGALLGTGFPYRSPDLAAAFFACTEAVLPLTRGIRRMGSAALDLSYVAAGFLQGFWESDLQVYDVAAGLLFLEMNGCPVTNERGEPYRPGIDRLLVCGWPAVHQELQPLVGWHYADEPLR